jgi:hypothetical protein
MIKEGQGQVPWGLKRLIVRRTTFGAGYWREEARDDPHGA